MRALGSSSAVLLRGLAHAAQAVGVSKRDLLSRIGMNEGDLDAEAPLPTATLGLAWHAATELSGDPFFGLHAGEHAEIGSYDVLDYLFLTSATLGEGCRALERYHGIVAEMWRVDLVVEHGLARFRHWVPPELVEPLWHAWDYFFAGSMKRVRTALPPGALKEVHLMHGEREPAEYLRVFECPVTFGNPIGEFVFGEAWLDQRLVSANATLHRLVLRHADELLARVPSDKDLLARARRLLPRLLSEPDPSLANLAQRLGASKRDVQRKLAEHGIRYVDLVERTREEHALRQLESGVATMQEIAFSLGYASAAAFSRAFRRWRGMSPRDFRLAHVRRLADR